MIFFSSQTLVIPTLLTIWIFILLNVCQNEGDATACCSRQHVQHTLKMCPWDFRLQYIGKSRTNPFPVRHIYLQFWVLSQQSWAREQKFRRKHLIHFSSPVASMFWVGIRLKSNLENFTADFGKSILFFNVFSFWEM